ncbi:MAG: hypothetical protein KJ908_04880 [Acidobacteria bacterium]|nr:hypothetical protein [Acidobacteriota bacterium]
MSFVEIIENYGMLIITGALVIVTFFYFLANQKMANVMKKEYELRVAPSVEIKLLAIGKRDLKLWIKFQIYNLGESRIQLSSVSIVLENKTSNNSFRAPRSPQRGIILPGQDKVIMFAFAPSVVPDLLLELEKMLPVKIESVLYYKNAIGKPFKEGFIKEVPFIPVIDD